MRAFMFLLLLSVGFFWSSCHLHRQQATKSLVVEESLTRAHHLEWQRTRLWTDSRGFSFYLQTDQPFSYHLDSGLIAQGGHFWMDYRRQYAEWDSTLVQQHAVVDSQYQLQSQQKDRVWSTAAPAVTGWKRKLVTVLVVIIVVGAVVIRWWWKWK